MSQTKIQRFLKGKLQTMMVLRVVLALVFLLITVWLQLRKPSETYSSFYSIYVFAFTIGVVTIVYAVLLKYLTNLRRFAYLQVAVDIVLVSTVVYMSGGIASYLFILYYISVIGSGIILGRRGALFAATCSAIAYGFILYMDYIGALPSGIRFLIPTKILWFDVISTLSMNVMALYSVAFLIGHLAETTVRVEKELEAKEIDLENLESLNRELVENINSGIMTLDESGAITSFNRGAEEITGYSLKEVYRLKGEELFDIFSDESLGAIPSGFRGEEEVTVRDGTKKFLGFTVSEGKGGDMNKIVIFQNLTELKSLEEQLRRDEKLKALGELSAGLAHEIRNPLASISGSIQVLRDGLELEGPDSRLMEIVMRETKRLNELITDFLLFARPVQKDVSVLDVTKVIEETVSVFRHSPEAKNITIGSTLDGPAYIEGNSRQVSQIFWNLFLNASHAMEDGGVLSINLKHILGDPASMGAAPEAESAGESAGSPFVEITVADTGVGIGTEDMERIFDPFYSTKSSGSGLGLAIVYRIVKSLGGSIDVKSSEGEGITFKLVIPELGEDRAQKAVGDI
jgi:two-component system sensor histidine kinase PilS (NtrC family)